MTRIQSGFRSAAKMEMVFGIAPLAVLCIISTAFISECSSAGNQGGYFLFTPPFGGDRPPQEVTASKRTGEGDINDIAPAARASVSPVAEGLWVGSHKINWSPLPLFQKFIDHHQQKRKYKQQRFEQAQARKYDPEDQQQQTLKGPLNTIADDSFNDRFGRYRKYRKPMFHNPHHDFSTKVSSGGFFAGLSAAFGKQNAPRVFPPKFAEPRSSTQPEGDYSFSPSTSSQPQRSQPTTPIPQFQSSTRGTILVSPAGTIAALSTPGPSISPIVDRLRQMTEWSKQSQQKSSFIKKEGTANSSPPEIKLRLKKRLRPSEKRHKHNIEAIILSNDDDIVNDPLSIEHNDRKIKKLSKSKRKPRVRNVSKEQNNSGGASSEEAVNVPRAFQLPKNEIVILNPTNAAFLNDPLDGQQSALKNYQLKRKDKKMDVFKTEDIASRPPPIVSFRFGAEDAKVNPYTN